MWKDIKWENIEWEDCRVCDMCGDIKSKCVDKTTNPENIWLVLCEKCYKETKQGYFLDLKNACEEISKLGDGNFIVCLGLIGFKRILEVVASYAKNYSIS